MTEPVGAWPAGHDDLAERLTELLARVKHLEQENADLRVARGSRPIPTGVVSRRDVLRRAGSVAAAGAGAIAGIALLAPSAIAATTYVLLNEENVAGDGVTTLVGDGGSGVLYVQNQGAGSAVYGHGASGYGVEALSDQGTAVYATALSPGLASLYGHKGTTGNAVVGEIDAPASHWGAVAGSTNGHGPAIIGENHSDGYGAQGRALGSGDGVFGESSLGRGGRFKGKKAQLKLEPSAAATHPGSGQKGDLFADASGRLWFCKGGTTWKQLA
jgi:hypothetical protein